MTVSARAAGQLLRTTVTDLLPNYEAIMALPQGGITQGVRLPPGAGHPPKDDPLVAQFWIADGQARFHGRSVIVFSGSGAVPDEHGEPGTSMGPTYGSALLDEATGIFTYLEFGIAYREPDSWEATSIHVVMRLIME